MVPKVFFKMDQFTRVHEVSSQILLPDIHLSRVNFWGSPQLVCDSSISPITDKWDMACIHKTKTGAGRRRIIFMKVSRNAAWKTSSSPDLIWQHSITKLIWHILISTVSPQRSSKAHVFKRAVKLSNYPILGLLLQITAPNDADLKYSITPRSE